jgi:hypothetical protein
MDDHTINDYSTNKFSTAYGTDEFGGGNFVFTNPNKMSKRLEKLRST